MADLSAMSHPSPGWSMLLDGNVADLVLVGRGDNVDHRAEQLRAFTQAEIPVLVTHPIHPSMLFFFELEMIREQTGALVRHDQSVAFHPAVDVLKSLVEAPSDTIGVVEQITIARTLSDRSRRTVLDQLARDVELVTRLAGEVQRVTALGAGAEDADFASLAVQMSCSGGAAVRWSVGSVVGRPILEVTLIGDKGRAALTLSHLDESAPHKSSECVVGALDILSNGARRSQEIAEWDEADDAIRRAVAALTDATLEASESLEQTTPTDAKERTRLSSDHIQGSTWLAAARSMEVTDAVERSLRKGRTIDLHSEQFSEASTFKGVMASVGCGLLIFCLAVSMIIGLLGAFGIKANPVWYLALLLVLLGFLLLQLLPRLVLADKDEGAESPDR